MIHHVIYTQKVQKLNAWSFWAEKGNKNNKDHRVTVKFMCLGWRIYFPHSCSFQKHSQRAPFQQEADYYAISHIQNTHQVFAKKGDSAFFLWSVARASSSNAIAFYFFHTSCAAHIYPNTLKTNTRHYTTSTSLSPLWATQLPPVMLLHSSACHIQKI